MSTPADTLVTRPANGALTVRQRSLRVGIGGVFVLFWLAGWATLSAAGAGDAEHRARVYRNRSAPRLSSTGKSLVLSPVRGSQNVAMIGAKLYGKTTDRTQTDDSYFGGANTRSALQFTRVTLQSATRPLADVQVDVILQVVEGDDERELHESFELGNLGPGDRVVIDTKGYIDVTGTEVSSSGMGLGMGMVITHEKRTHYKTKVKSVVIKLYEAGKLVYAAASTPEERSALEAEIKD